MQLIRKIRNAITIFSETSLYSQFNVGYMWRFSVLLVLEFIARHIKYFVDLKKWVSKKIARPFLFQTPFGTYLAHTQNAWYVMKADYEPEIGAVIAENLSKYEQQNDRVFINIGTHIGRWTIDIAKRGYACHCFEPSPETLRFLRANIALSNVYDRVMVHPYALWDKEGSVEFMYVPDHDGGSYVIQEWITPHYEGVRISVPVKPIDSVVLPVENIRLMIIDVEGFEEAVVNGGLQFFSALRSVDIIMEIFEISSHRDSLISTMKSLGYTARQIEKDNWLFSK